MFRLLARVVVACVCVGALCGAQARADDPPVIVVVESGGSHVDAALIRRGMAAALGVPVVSILEGMQRPNLGVLAVALTARGRRAAISFMPSDGTRYAVMIEVTVEGSADARGEWLIAPCLAAVRTSNERRAVNDPPPELLDPWIASRVFPRASGAAPQEVLDPWVGTPRRRARVVVSDFYLGDEILDPWAEAIGVYRGEQAERLGTPSPGAAVAPRPRVPPRRVPPRSTPARAR